MPRAHFDDLDGPLAIAVQAAWDNELPQARVDLASSRILSQLKLAGGSKAFTSTALFGMADRFESRIGRLLVWVAIAASLVVGAFFVGRFTFSRADHAVVADGGNNSNSPPIENKVETFGFARSTGEIQFGRVPPVSVQAIQRAGSTDPSDLILFGKGPRESIALGQGFLLDSPFVRGLGIDQRGSMDRFAGTPVDSSIKSGLFIHVFDPQVSPRSRVLTKNEVAGRYVVSPDGKWIVTQYGLQIEVETEMAVQLPGDWSRVQRVEFVGLAHLMLMRTREGYDKVKSCQLEILSFPSLESQREIVDVDRETLFANMNLEHSTGEAIGVLTAERKVRIYDATGEKHLVETTKPIVGNLRAIAISANKQWMATSSGDSSLYIYDTSTGEPKHRLPSKSGPLDVLGTNAIAFSPDNRFLAAGVGQVLVVYDVETGRVVKKFPKNSGMADQIFWSSDGRSLTSVIHSFVQRYPDGSERYIYPSMSLWSF